MQYLLSEEEYNKLKADAVKHKEKYDKKLANFCQTVADNMPVAGWHASGDDVITINGTEMAPWECIHSQDDWYCDKCPCTEICPMPKSWSK